MKQFNLQAMLLNKVFPYNNIFYKQTAGASIENTNSVLTHFRDANDRPFVYSRYSENNPHG